MKVTPDIIRDHVLMNYDWKLDELYKTDPIFRTVVDNGANSLIDADKILVQAILTLSKARGQAEAELLQRIQQEPAKVVIVEENQ